MNNFLKKYKNQKGYAILFTVIIVSAISVITAGLTNAAYKQIILSSLAKDSQSAFYEADTAADCALYADQIETMKSPPNIFTTGLFRCGGSDLVVDNISADGYTIYPIPEEEDSLNACFRIDVTKTPIEGSGPGAPTWVDSSLIAWWPFDGNADDSQGNYNGSASPSLTTTSTGCKLGECYMFNDNSDYVALPSNITLSDATYSFWISREDISDDRLILSDDPYMSRIFLTTAGYVRLETDTNSQEFEYWFSPTSQSTLTHILLSRSGDQMSLYVNGVFIHTTTVSGADTLTISQIGRNGRSFRGALDEVMIWDRPLDGDEVKNVYDWFSSTGGGTTTKISAKGYNICDKSNLRTVEREIEINYQEEL